MVIKSKDDFLTFQKISEIGGDFSVMRRFVKHLFGDIGIISLSASQHRIPDKGFKFLPGFVHIHNRCRNGIYPVIFIRIQAAVGIDEGKLLYFVVKRV